MNGFCVTLMALPSRLNALKDFNDTISLLKASKSLQRPQKPYQLSFLRPATHSRHRHGTRLRSLCTLTVAILSQTPTSEPSRGPGPSPSGPFLLAATKPRVHVVEGDI